MAKKMQTVADAETARQVFVARALYWADRAGYSNDARSGLRKIGLGDYVGTRNEIYTIKLDRLLAQLGQALQLTIDREDTPRQSSALENRLYELGRDFRRSLTEDDYVKESGSDKIVNVDEVTAAYGRVDALPPVSGDEPHAVWTELVAAVLRWADVQGLCSTVEDALRRMGFEAFIPEREKVMDVTWRGITFPGVVVALKRDGTLDQDSLYRSIHMVLRNEYTEVTATEPPAPVAAA